jgi:hypothetical protein
MTGAMIREILDVIIAVVTKAWMIADGGVPRKPQAWLRSAPGVSVVPEVPNDVDSWSPPASGRTDQGFGRPRAAKQSHSLRQEQFPVAPVQATL